MLLEMILCEFEQICTTGNDLQQLLDMILCKVGRICATGNALMLLKRFYAGLD